MSTSAESPLLNPREGPAVRVMNPGGQGGALLVCEHAARFIPAALDGLGLDAEARVSHAAWDIGAMEVALELMAELDAPLVAARVSRLVYDCNRPPEASDAVPARSERFDVPGNAGLSAAAHARRVAGVYLPFRTALAAEVARHKTSKALVTIHSFTPVFNGVKRDVQLGILHDSDDRMARALMAAARAGTALRVALNQPYAAADGVTHTLREHALAAGMPNVMIEIRNDLIDTPAGVRAVTADLSAMLKVVLAEIGLPGVPNEANVEVAG